MSKAGHSHFKDEPQSYFINNWLIDFFTDSTFDGSILAENHILIRENW